MKNFNAHILVVDDDDGIRDLVKQYLDQNNFLVSTAKSAEDAFEKVKIIPSSRFSTACFITKVKQVKSREIMQSLHKMI